jgi:hypothetical protein
MKAPQGRHFLSGLPDLRRPGNSLAKSKFAHSSLRSFGHGENEDMVFNTYQCNLACVKSFGTWTSRSLGIHLF